ncbi:hypothetical protein Taro_044540 [Colocasia esculenta]|uniref:Uncharacterized protein n=1 Tax=Colocasia esculenta TaxID=4460 RepID=A0A843X3G1_COLES|nr:hypothetical protein [Colocasia esculenta]
MKSSPTPPHVCVADTSGPISERIIPCLLQRLAFSCSVPIPFCLLLPSFLPLFNLHPGEGQGFLNSGFLFFLEFPSLAVPKPRGQAVAEMGFVSTLMGLCGFGMGVSAGVVIGYFMFIYFQPTDVKDPLLRPLVEQDSKSLQRMLPEIPLWVKNPDFDRVDWLNKFLEHMWPYLDKAICKTAKEIAKPIIAENTAKYKIDSVEFQTLTLGTLPPTLQGMKVYDTDEKELIMEPSLKWASNPNITVVVKAFGLKATVQIVDLQVFALPRITLKPLVPSFPCFAKILVSLMEKPHVDFGLKLLGADVMAIPGLYRVVQVQGGGSYKLLACRSEALQCLEACLPDQGIAPPEPVGVGEKGLQRVVDVPWSSFVKKDWARLGACGVAEVRGAGPDKYSEGWPVKFWWIRQLHDGSFLEIIKDQVANMYLWPKTLEVPIMDPSKAQKKPVGILHVKVVRALNLKKTDFMGKSDPYVKLKLTEDKLPSKKTTVKRSTLNPEWNEEFKLIVKDPESQALELSVYDWEQVGKHDKLGMNVIPLKDLTTDETKELTLNLLKNMDPNDAQNEKPRGQIVVEATYKPFKEEDLGKDFDESSNAVEKAPEGTPAGGGLLVVIVHEAQDLEGKHHTNPFVRILFRGEEKKTRYIKKNRDPRWEEEFSFMCEEPPVNDRIHVEVVSKAPSIGIHSKEEEGGWRRRGGRRLPHLPQPPRLAPVRQATAAASTPPSKGCRRRGLPLLASAAAPSSLPVAAAAFTWGRRRRWASPSPPPPLLEALLPPLLQPSPPLPP